MKSGLFYVQIKREYKDIKQMGNKTWSSEGKQRVFS